MAVYQKYIEADHAADLELFLRLIRANSLVLPQGSGGGLQAALLSRRVDKRSASTDYPVGWISEAHPPANSVDNPAGQISGAHPPANWHYIACLADRHQAAPILYFNLRKLGWEQCLPADVRDYLRTRYLRVTGDNMRFRQRLLDIASLLESRGVPVVSFKGPVLAHCLYGDSALRQYQDLDLLVPATEAVRAWETIQSAGYHPKRLRLTKDQFKKFVSCSGEFDFVADDGQAPLDLHWRLSMQTSCSYDYEFCRKRLITVTFDQRQLLCLSAEDMVVYLCVHGAYNVWMNAGAVLWVAEYIDQYSNMDWDLVLELADALSCRRMLFLGLFLARDLFGVALSESVTDRIDKDRAVAGLAEQVYACMLGGRPRTGHFQWRLSEIPFQLKVRDKWAARAQYLVRRLFRPTQKDWEKFPLSARLSFLYFLLRPVALGVEWARNKVVR